MKAKVILLILFLAFGYVCFYGARRLLAYAGESSLHLRLVPIVDEGKTHVKVFFINTGDHALALNTNGINFFVYLCDASKTSLLQIWNENQNAPGKFTGFTVLEPGDGIDVGDAYSVVKNLPAGTKSITAVYEAAALPDTPGHVWHGVVRSPILPIETERR